jgi:hypothetical protein
MANQPHVDAAIQVLGAIAVEHENSRAKANATAA